MRRLIDKYHNVVHIGLRNFFLVYSVQVGIILILTAVDILTPGFEELEETGEFLQSVWIILVLIGLFFGIGYGVPLFRRYVFSTKASVTLHILCTQLLIHIDNHTTLISNERLIQVTDYWVLNYALFYATYFCLVVLDNIMYRRRIGEERKFFIQFDSFIDGFFSNFFFITLAYTGMSYVGFWYVDLGEDFFDYSSLLLLAMFAPYIVGPLYMLSLFFGSEKDQLVHSSKHVFFSAAWSFVAWLIAFFFIAVMNFDPTVTVTDGLTLVIQMISAALFAFPIATLSYTKFFLAPHPKVGEYVAIGHYALIPYVSALFSIGILYPLGSPTLLAPAPFVIALPAIFADSIGLVPLLLVLWFLCYGVFYALNLHLRTAETKPIPWRIPLVMLTLNIANIIHFLYSWGNAIQYQGVRYFVILAAINTIFIAAFWVLWFMWRRETSYKRALFLNVLLQVWLFWYAFPWLGEVI